MTYKDNVRHGLWGVVGLLIPSLIVVAAYGVPSIVAFVAVAVAFFIGEARGKRETADKFIVVLQEDRAALQDANEQIKMEKAKANKYIFKYLDSKGDNIDLRYKLSVAGAKIQRLTERFVNGK